MLMFQWEIELWSENSSKTVRSNLISVLFVFVTEDQLPQEIVAPRTIQEVPDKLLSSGIYLPGKLHWKYLSFIWHSS